VSSSTSNLKLVALAYSPDDGHVRYSFDADGRAVEYSAKAADNGGIRGVEFPEEFDAFLRGYMAADGMVVRRLVKATWESVDGEQPTLPLALVRT
jgi:hypothetical protein